MKKHIKIITITLLLIAEQTNILHAMHDDITTHETPEGFINVTPENKAIIAEESQNNSTISDQQITEAKNLEQPVVPTVAPNINFDSNIAQPTEETQAPTTNSQHQKFIKQQQRYQQSGQQVIDANPDISPQDQQILTQPESIYQPGRSNIYQYMTKQQKVYVDNNSKKIVASSDPASSTNPMNNPANADNLTVEDKKMLSTPDAFKQINPDGSKQYSNEFLQRESSHVSLVITDANNNVIASNDPISPKNPINNPANKDIMTPQDARAFSSENNIIVDSDGSRTYSTVTKYISRNNPANEYTSVTVDKDNKIISSTDPNSKKHPVISTINNPEQTLTPQDKQTIAQAKHPSTNYTTGSTTYESNGQKVVIDKNNNIILSTDPSSNVGDPVQKIQDDNPGVMTQEDKEIIEQAEQPTTNPDGSITYQTKNNYVTLKDDKIVASSDVASKKSIAKKNEGVITPQDQAVLNDAHIKYNDDGSITYASNQNYADYVTVDKQNNIIASNDPTSKKHPIIPLIKNKVAMTPQDEYVIANDSSPIKFSNGSTRYVEFVDGKLHSVTIKNNIIIESSDPTSPINKKYAASQNQVPDTTSTSSTNALFPKDHAPQSPEIQNIINSNEAPYKITTDLTDLLINTNNEQIAQQLLLSTNPSLSSLARYKTEIFTIMNDPNMTQDQKDAQLYKKASIPSSDPTYDYNETQIASNALTTLRGKNADALQSNTAGIALLSQDIAALKSQSSVAYTNFMKAPNSADLKTWISTTCTILWKNSAVSVKSITSTISGIFKQANVQDPNGRIADSMSNTAFNNLPKDQTNLQAMAKWISSMTNMVSDAIFRKSATTDSPQLPNTLNTVPADATPTA